MKKLLLNHFTIIGMLIGILFWFFDSVIDGLFFQEQRSIYISMFYPEPVEIYIRVLTFFLFLFYGIYTGHIRLQLLAMNVDLKRKQIALESEIEKREVIEDKLEKASLVDPLTQIFNRRKIIYDLQHMLSVSHRYKNVFSIIMCDIDKFKKVNDVLGHITGDQCLVQFCRLVNKTIRKSDIFARYGGEEFLIVLPFTDREKAVLIAEKVRSIVSTKLVISGHQITASFGVTEVEKDDTFEKLVARADRALYRSKKRGRNRVSLL